jgi:hypothetical protein
MQITITRFIWFNLVIIGDPINHTYPSYCSVYASVKPNGSALFKLFYFSYNNTNINMRILSSAIQSANYRCSQPVVTLTINN